MKKYQFLHSLYALSIYVVRSFLFEYMFMVEDSYLKLCWFNSHVTWDYDKREVMLDFLDFQVNEMKWKIARYGSNPLILFRFRKKLVLENLLEALQQQDLREEIIAFFQMPEISYERANILQKKIDSLWRSNNVTDPGRRGNWYADHVVPQPVRSIPAVISVPPITIFTRTYVIASHLYFELEGKEPEYEALSRDIPRLKTFIQEQFINGHPHLTPLAGTIADFRGYSYKGILKGKDTSKKGQLKPCFRQIMGNPEVFGNAVARRAKNIYEEFLND